MGIGFTDGAPGFIDYGLFNIALNVSPFNEVYYPVVTGGIGNVGVNLFGNNNLQTNREVIAGGLASIAANIGGKSNDVWAQGKLLNTAVGIFGTNSRVLAYDGLLNGAVQTFGKGNFVESGKGPLSFAASFFQAGKTVIKQKPGVNINGFKVPNTAATIRPAASNVRKAAASAKPAAGKRAHSNS